MPIDYSKYPPNWKTEIVPRILERDENRCAHCGFENYQMIWSVPVKIHNGTRDKVKRVWVASEDEAKKLSNITSNSDRQRIKRVKVVLTIAHLDHDELNHMVSDNRLRALCQRCHFCYDAEEKQRRKNNEQYD